MLEADGRVIMVSGANRGIGAATVRALAAKGYRLSLGARQPSAISADDLPDGTLVHHWDATMRETSASWAAATVERFGRIDGVVMNAGVELGGSLEEGDESEFDTMWEVNFKGPLRLIRAVLPELRRSGHGRVVNVVSLAGKRLLRHEILGYSASKFAAISLTHAVRQSGWEDGVRATSICPGLVDTDMVAGVTPAAGAFKIEPETIGETVAYALSLPNSAVVAEVLINSRLEPMF